MTAGVACGSCGAGMRDSAKFCHACGTPTAASGDTAEYKQVTLLFADVVRSMDIAAALDIERLREVMTDVVEHSAAVLRQHGGTVEYHGDGVMAIFGAPIALEDHAFRACLAGLAIQEETNRLATEVEARDGVALRLRVGLNSGRVIAGEIGSGSLGYAATGEQVGMAQRIESVAAPGAVLLSESTARLVEHSVTLSEPKLMHIKGANEPIPVRQLVAIEPHRGIVGRTEASLIGRRWEMVALEEVLDRAIAGRGCVVNLVGPPGIGKSRIARQAATLAAVRGVVVAWTFCESHARDISFGVVAGLLRAGSGVADLEGDAARARVREQVPAGADPEDLVLLDDLLGIADPEVPLPEIDPDSRHRRLTALINTASLARTQPALFIIEDAHWIDAASESMLADLLAVIPHTPSMVLITARPEYGGALTRVRGAQTIALAALANSDMTELLRELVGSDPSVGDLTAILAERAAGNPFFAEEMVRELAQRGVLGGERGGYVCRSDIAEVSVPATVQAAIGARIDRLRSEAKQTLNAASVIGARFDMDTLGLLLPEAVPAHLDELLSAELIDQTEFVPRQRYCFRHPLVRTVAYESQLSANRAHTHRTLAAAIAARDPGAADENAALIATHFEAASEVADAYRWHMRAAEWLRARDLPAARAQWESARRIADQLPDNEVDVVARRIAPRTMLISTMLFTGSGADTDEHYREFRDLTVQIGDLRSLALATAGLIFSFAVNDNRVPEAAALASELEDMVSLIDCDAETMSIILNALAFVRFANCEFDAALKVIDAIHALPPGVPAVELISANALLGTIEMCAGRAEQGRRRIRDEIEHARALPGDRYALVLIYLVVTTALGVDQADEMVDRARDALRRAESLGDTAGVITAQMACGMGLLRLGDAARNEAMDTLHSVRAYMREHGVLTFALPAITADLAIAAGRRGRIDEAIDELRETFALHMAGGSHVLVGCAGEALVGLLIERGSTDDLAEARRLIDQWQSRPGIAALDLWWLKSRALLAKTQHNSDGYAELSRQYLELCEKLDARGRLAEARRMVG